MVSGDQGRHSEVDVCECIGHFKAAAAAAAAAAHSLAGYSSDANWFAGSGTAAAAAPVAPATAAANFKDLAGQTIVLMLDGE